MLKSKEIQLVSKPVAYIPLVYPDDLLHENKPARPPVPIVGDAMWIGRPLKILEAMDSPEEAQQLIEFYARKRKLTGVAFIRPVFFDELIETMCHIDVALSVRLAARLKPIFLRAKILPMTIPYIEKAWDRIPVGCGRFQILNLIYSSWDLVAKLTNDLKTIRLNHDVA